MTFNHDNNQLKSIVLECNVHEIELWISEKKKGTANPVVYYWVCHIYIIYKIIFLYCAKLILE
jgi:hypothetical protein